MIPTKLIELVAVLAVAVVSAHQFPTAQKAIISAQIKLLECSRSSTWGHAQTP
jgi:hypothetical protein